MTALAAQSRALDGVAYLRGREAGQRTEIRVAVRRTHFDGLEADHGEFAQRALEILGQSRAHRPGLAADRHAQRVGVQRPRRGQRRRRCAEELSSVEVHTESGLQPLRYSRERYLLASGDVGDLAVRRVVVQTAPRAQRHRVQIHRLRNSAGMQETAGRLRAALAGCRPLAQARRQLSGFAGSARRRGRGG